MKLIILEGPDGSGKTTLAKALQRATNGVVLHGASMGDRPGVRPDNEKIMRAFHDNMLDVAERNLEHGHWVIMDRHWMSHVVYGAASGWLTAGDRHAYRAHFYQRLTDKACYVFCLSDECIRIHRENQDPEHPYNDDYLVKVYGLYKEIRAEWGTRGPHFVPFRSYDLTQYTTPEALEKQARSIASWAWGL